MRLNGIFRNFMESITAAMSEEEKQFVRKRLDEAVKDTSIEEAARIAFETTYMHWLFIRDGESAKDLLLSLLRGEEK